MSQSQLAMIYAEGVVSHSTATHRGIHLSSDRNKRVDVALRADGGWYEEDAEWAIVAITFPDLFTSHEHKRAHETYPEQLAECLGENLHGLELAPGESWAKDKAAFDRAYADDWIAVSAIQSDYHPDMTEVITTRGGRRNGHAEEMRFLVPAPNTKRVAPSASSSILAVTLPKRGLPVL